MIGTARSFFDRVFKTEFRRNILALISGNLIYQAISFASYPILTRLYPTEIFGQYALFNSIALLLGLVFTLRYEMAIPLLKDEYEARTLKKFLFFLSAGIAVMAVLLAYLVQLTGFLESLGNYIYAIPLVALTSSQLQINRLWRLFANQIVAFYKVFISQRLLYTLIAIALPFTLLTFENGLIITLLTSSLLVLPFLLPKEAFGKFDRATTRRLLLANYRYPKYSLPSFLLFNIASQVPIFLISQYLGASTTGQYAIAFNLLFIPNSLIMTRISESLYTKFATSDAADIRHLIFTIWKYVGGLMIVPCVVLFLFGRELCLLLLGPEWGLAGEIAEYFAIIIFFSSFNASVSSVINVLALQYINFWMSLYRLIYLSVSFTVAGYTQNLMLGIQLMVIFATVQQFIYGGIIVRNLRQKHG